MSVKASKVTATEDVNYSEEQEFASENLDGVLPVRKRPPAQLYSRSVSSGLDIMDMLKLQARCDQGGEDWVTVCEELGDYDYQYAAEQLKKGRTITARHFFFSAAAVYRIGQYGLQTLTEEKLRIYHKLDDSFSQAAKLCNPSLEPVRIPYKNYEMEGWLLLPKNAPEHCPIVLMIPGATGFKEEYIVQAHNMVERGMAVLLMDGPGQGTTLYFNNGYLEVELEKAYSKMLDFIDADGRFGKIGIIGGSTGGYYAPRAAATDKRIRACVMNAGSYYPQEICINFPAYHHKFALLCGVSDEEMTERWKEMTLEGLAEQIDCSLLIVHGDADPTFSLEGVKRVYVESPSKDKEIVVYPGVGHCSAGIENESYRLMADWLSEKLL